jgi:hypothetical protein
MYCRNDISRCGSQAEDCMSKELATPATRRNAAAIRLKGIKISWPLVAVAGMSAALATAYMMGAASDDDFMMLNASSAGTHRQAATASGGTASALAGSAGMDPNAQWVEDRDDQLQEQRRIAEMMPNTPGVRPDQYVGEGDDSSFVHDDDDEKSEKTPEANHARNP